LELDIKTNFYIIKIKKLEDFVKKEEANKDDAVAMMVEEEERLKKRNQDLEQFEERQ